jgi:PAS domain S-box-containing protein
MQLSRPDAEQSSPRRLYARPKNTNETFHQRESELAQVQQIAKIGTVTVDLRHGFRNGRRSQEYCAIHGLAPDAEDTHEDWVARLHPDDREKTLRRFQDAVLRADEQYSVEYRIIRPSDGQVRWIATEARIERDADGKPLRLIGAHMDVTERVFAREMLRESEQRFRQISDSAPVPIWVSNLDGTRAFANIAYCQFLGVEYDAALAFDWRKIIHPDDLSRILKEQVVGERSLQAFSLEARYRRSDGEWRWIRSESQPRQDPSGKHLGFIGVAHDITTARVAESELRRLNDMLATQVEVRTRERDRIWSVSQDLLLVTDRDGNWLSTNPAWTATLGWSQHDLNTRNAEQLRNSQIELTRLLTADPNARFSLPLPNSDGTKRWISWTATTDQDAIYAVGRDVTGERQSQEDLRVAQEALRQSQKLEAMGQLTGGVAHDFNNLLTPILGSLDMLQRRGVGTEREQRLIGGALQSADRAKTLVQRLLAFARRQPLQPVAVDIVALVTGMAQLVESTTGPQIQVVVNAPDHVPRANADPNQLEMAILNLSVNARDAMVDGGTLRISVSGEVIGATHRSGLPAGRYVAISVADTGAGMPDDVAARAIEPFYSTKGVGKGTGLGLSMVHGLSLQLGGALRISSKLGVGTNVELWLPVNDDVTLESAAAPENRPSDVAGIALLVDDEDIVRLSTADMLSEMGFAVIEASSAEEALRLVERGQQFDLLVTDHLMPGMSGVDLIDRLRADRPAIPVLIVSGFAEAEGVDPNLPRLTKPFRQKELSASITALMAAQPR